MSESADRWWDELRREAELPPPPPRSRAPVILGAAAAAAASAAMAWWFAAPDSLRFHNPEVAQMQARPAPLRLAAATADPEQVRRAYEDFTDVYATMGAAGVDRFSASCAASLKGDPRILDFCLAFDLFAASVRPAGDDDVRPAALVRTAMPGAVPAQRIAEVRRLMRQVSGVPEAPLPAAGPGVQKASAPVRTASLQPAVARKTDPCAGMPRADRLVCAFPSLAAQHRQMRAAYDRALAAGADPLEIDRAQAEWREQRAAVRDKAQLSILYQRRIRELSAAAAPKPPPLGERPG